MLRKAASLSCLLLILFAKMNFAIPHPPPDESVEEYQDADDGQGEQHVTFNPLEMHPPQGTGADTIPVPPKNNARRHFRKPTGVNPGTTLSDIAGPSVNTPRSAAFSTDSIGRRSILTTPGLSANHIHPERFDGQFIQPRFKNQILKDLAIAATEFQGTLVFLLIAFIGSNPAASVNEVALAYAMGLLSTIVMHSSSQANPAISILQAALGKLSPRQAAMNIGAQITASIAASGIQTLACGDTWSVAELTVSPARGLLVETILSTVLFTTVLWVSAMPSVQKATMPFLISLIFLGCELAGIRVTSASLNSARQLGPAIVSGRWHHYDFIYHLGPAIAVPLSLLVFKANQLLQSPDAAPSAVGPGQLVDTYRLERRGRLPDEDAEEV